MAHHRPEPYGARHVPYRKTAPYIGDAVTREVSELDAIDAFLSHRLIPAIRRDSDRPVKVIVNLGHMEQPPEGAYESSNTIIYNAPGASMVIREAGYQLKTYPPHPLAPTRHSPPFRNPSPVRAIIGGVEGEDHDRPYFRSISPGAPAAPSPGCRYVRTRHSPPPSPSRQPHGVRHSLRPISYNRVFGEGPPQPRVVLGTTLRDRLLHSHAHPHARWCRGCHHRHRNINTDGYCPQCVYVLHTAPLPHRRVEEAAPGIRPRHVPPSELGEIRVDRDHRMASPGMLKAGRQQERRHPDLMMAETDNTSDEYELFNVRGRQAI
ncbi:hypothetical protein QC761_213700 [Podospora bellae-mahoneyi]|uniref:Uncharacterized protein n=1 Tax=Podospora bellae-mahoneyi TaxID=2093777 RepID=A0ABR0FS96_9PEZI|nr:hypothetical protein QC761_213700 [Podospora bellae-mahoneyi]